MVEPSSVSNPDVNSDPSRKQRRKIGPDSTGRAPADACEARWTTETELQIYSSKLVDSLRHLPRPRSADATGRAVHDAAYRVLACSAKGKSRWSRAILTRRMRARLAQINKKYRRAARPGAGLKKPRPLQGKVRVLSRLVPGCRKLSLPNLLEETADYIAAMEMQVKAMTFLTGLLNGGVSGGH